MEIQLEKVQEDIGYGFQKKEDHLTSDAIKIEPKAVVMHYCVWFDFYCIRR